MRKSGWRRASAYVLWKTVILGTLRIAYGQTTVAICENNTTTSWLFNGEGQSPCLVWSRLQSLCLPSTSYINVPALKDHSFGYDLPNPSTRSSLCQCNSITYGLAAGCSFCQVGERGSWAGESEWRDICGGSWIDQGLGFQEDVVGIPAYAWKGWNGERWEPSQASQSASLFVSMTPSGPTSLSRSFPSPTQTQTQTSSSSTTTSSSSSSSPSSTAGRGSEGHDAQSKAEKWGPIVGGITGGVIVLVLLFVHFRRYSRRKKMGLYRDGGKEGESSEEYAGAKQSASKGGRGTGRTSFFDLFGRGDRDHKRQTEMIVDPFTFKNPRPAPVPDELTVNGEKGKKGVGQGDGEGYLTTTQRLRRLTDDSVEANVDAEARRAAAALTPLSFNPLSDQDQHERTLQDRGHTPGRGTLIVHNADSDDSLDSPESTPRTIPLSSKSIPQKKNKSKTLVKNRSKNKAGEGMGENGSAISPIRRDRQVTQDFSVARPNSSYTLPSLYEPPTGAPTFRETQYSSYTQMSTKGVGQDQLGGTIRGDTMYSMNSRYPPTVHEYMVDSRDSGHVRGLLRSQRNDGIEADGERGDGVGVALGSGRRGNGEEGYWSRQSLPPVPRNVSDDSAR